MSFPRRLLNEDEEVVLDLHPHWWYFATHVTTVVALLAGTVASVVTDAPSAVQDVMVGLLLLGVLWLVARWIRWRSTSFVLTNHRVVHRSGVIAKSGREIPLDHINDISYYASMFARIIGAGDLRIESAGERGGQEVFSDLPRPSRIQNEMYRQIQEGKRLAAGGGVRQLSIPEQIEKLDELRRRGVVTDAEFEAKKSELLDRM